MCDKQKQPENQEVPIDSTLLAHLKSKLSRLSALLKREESSDAEDDLSFYHDGEDVRVNSLTSPPPEEEIRIPTIWAFEVYTPTCINNLRRGATTLGWVSSDGMFINPDFTNRVEDFRSRASGGGWLNLGYIVNEGKSTWPMHRQGPLPDKVRSIRAAIHQPLPSTTILICQFLFEESAIISVEQTLRAEYATYSTPIRGGRRFISVENQKHEATNTMRAYLRSICTNWIKEHVPGYFSSEYSISGIPTCELVTFKHCRPYEPIGTPIYSFLQMLNLEHNYQAWKTDDAKGMFFQFFEVVEHEFGRAVITGKLDEMLAGQSLEAYGKDRESQILNWVRYLDHTLGAWVLYVLTLDFEKQLGMIRDDYGNIDISNIKTAAKDAIHIDHKLLHLQRDVVPFADDLTAYCENEHVFMHEVCNFSPANDRRKAGNLFKSMKEAMVSKARYLVRVEAQTRAIAIRVGQVISSITTDKLANSNLKLQRGVYWMTFMLLVLTVVLVFAEFKDYTVDWVLIQRVLHFGS